MSRAPVPSGKPSSWVASSPNAPSPCYIPGSVGGEGGGLVSGLSRTGKVGGGSGEKELMVALDLWLIEASKCATAPLDCKSRKNRAPMPGTW